MTEEKSNISNQLCQELFAFTAIRDFYHTICPANLAASPAIANRARTRRKTRPECGNNNRRGIA
jgi:hypothetical protein